MCLCRNNCTIWGQHLINKNEQDFRDIAPMASNNITDVQSISEGLKTNNTLKELDLRNNNIT